MIYRDNAFISHIQDWATIGVVYVGHSEATNYPALSDSLDIVVDYDLPEGVQSTPVVGSGGTYDPHEEALKRKKADQASTIEAMKKRQEQSEKDGAPPKIVEENPPQADTPAFEDIGNNLEEDPFVM